MNDSTLFVVRVWRWREVFRASVRRVDDEQVQWFDSAEAMARYLDESAQGETAARAPDTDGGWT